MSETVSKLGRRRQRLLSLVVVLGSLGLGFALVEGVCLFLEHQSESTWLREGPGGIPDPHPTFGWLPTQGEVHLRTNEFDIRQFYNQLSMNDEPYVAGADDDKVRILALGDSHTMATGVSLEDSWGKRLQAKLRDKKGPAFRVYNAGVGGYSLHQYLLRLKDSGPKLKPKYVIVGFSYATDLFDLLPPDHGGWAYFEAWERDYFDFDDKGRLTQRHWSPSPVDDRRQLASSEAPRASSVLGWLRSQTFRFAITRRLRRSKFALAIGARVRVGGQSLWPNMEVVTERNVSPQHEYNWKLAEALLLAMRDEANRLGAQFIVLGIPYLPQVYEEVWRDSYGGSPKHDWDAAQRRLAEWCRGQGIRYVESTGALRARHKETGRWLHFREDGHPTPEGHDVLAQVLLDEVQF